MTPGTDADRAADRRRDILIGLGQGALIAALALAALALAALALWSPNLPTRSCGGFPGYSKK